MSLPDFPAENSTPHVKICGLTRAADATLAIELGAAFLGLIFAVKSPRRVPMEAAREIARLAASAHIPVFGVFVDEPVEAMLALKEEIGLAALQIHGSIPPELPVNWVIPAVAIRSEADGAALLGADLAHPALLADAFAAGMHGGTGKVFDHRYVQPLFTQRRIFVAGGLTPENIGSIVAGLADGPLPYAFDLSSGVESSPGVKDPARLRSFFTNLAEAFA